VIFVLNTAYRHTATRVARTLFTAFALACVGVAALAADDQDESPSIDLRGSNRVRYERLAPQYRAGFGGSDTALAIQTSLAATVEWDRFSLVGEILDARAELNDEQSFFPGVVNTLEPIQTYAVWRFIGPRADGVESSVRFGRMTIDVGKRRLLARSNFRHAVASFSGVDWQWRNGAGAQARAFYTIPMRTQPATGDELLSNDQELDRGARDTGFWGVYYLFAPLPSKTQIDVSYLGLDSPRGTGEIAGPIDIGTLSLRIFRPVPMSGVNYEVEAGLQEGDSASTAGAPLLEHRAYYAHAEIGFAFAARWSPNLLFQYDRASGDSDPLDSRNERFNPLFGERRFDFGPTSIYGSFQRGNIDSTGIRLTFTPAERWRAMAAYRGFKLAESRDAWVGSGYRDVTGQSGSSLGRQFESSFTWNIVPSRLSFETGFALVHSGHFPRQTAGTEFRGSPRYLYAAVTTTF
jgi:hypothetical protein